ncbi:MAG: hypothetical protein L0I80_04525, partial [Brevibacterium sp.]|nr:hypothetical protein [Brevibacterium sp.]
AERQARLVGSDQLGRKYRMRHLELATPSARTPTITGLERPWAWRQPKAEMTSKTLRVRRYRSPTSARRLV